MKISTIKSEINIEESEQKKCNLFDVDDELKSKISGNSHFDHKFRASNANTIKVLFRQYISYRMIVMFILR